MSQLVFSFFYSVAKRSFHKTDSQEATNNIRKQEYALYTFEKDCLSLEYI